MQESVMVEWMNGTRMWYANGKLHRIDGPAIEWANGAREWYEDGLRGRMNGPALVCANGNKLWTRRDLFYKNRFQIGLYVQCDATSYIVASRRSWKSFKSARSHYGVGYGFGITRLERLTLLGRLEAWVDELKSQGIL